MQHNKRHNQTAQMVLAALLIALVVVFQTVSNFIKVGPVSITLTLIPVVLGGALLGKRWGAGLGFLFGVMVTAFVLFGVDMGGNLLFQARPVITVLLCLFKGTAAGLVAAAVYDLMQRRAPTLAACLAATVAPVVNTGIFVLAMLIFYPETLSAWAGGSDIVIYILTGLAGWNFVFEFAAALILIPVLTTVLRTVGRRR